MKKDYTVWLPGDEKYKEEFTADIYDEDDINTQVREVAEQFFEFEYHECDGWESWQNKVYREVFVQDPDIEKVFKVKVEAEHNILFYSGGVEEIEIKQEDK